jgi:transcription initiation factor TFIID subunit TAF12
LTFGCNGYFWNIFRNGVKLVQELSLRGEEMNIQSVASSINAYGNSGVQASQATQSQQVQQTEKREPRPEERVERKEEPPRPVKNAQGQETGTLVNVTA